jgi:hypothetical protein
LATFGFQYIEGPTHLIEKPCGTSTFIKGDAVYIGTGGRVKLAASDDRIFGIAQEDVGDWDEKILIHEISPDQLWVGESDGTANIGMEGKPYGLNLTSGSQAINYGDTGPSVIIHQYDPQEDAVATAHKLIFRFQPDTCQGLVG